MRIPGPGNRQPGVSDHVAWYARDEPPRERPVLTAGPLEALFDDGGLRRVRFGPVTLARRIYVAVRDLNSNSIPGIVSNVVVQIRDGSFRVDYTCRHLGRAIDFEWRGVLEGSHDGTISLTMDGLARRDFPYYRIGICVHHSIDSCAGRAIRAETPAGIVATTLPRAIEPMGIRDGVYLALVPACRALEIDQADGATVRLEFDGDLMEMEDQRNWGDADLKTFSTPLATGAQFAAAGTEIRRRLVLKVVKPAADDLATSLAGRHPARPLSKEPGSTRPALRGGERVEQTRPVELHLGGVGGGGRPLPRLGLGTASDGAALSGREVELLRALRLDHLRVDLRLWDEGYVTSLATAAGDAAKLGCELELALFVSGSTSDAYGQLAHLAAQLATAGPSVARVLVFQEPGAHESTTPGSLVRLTRERLAAAVPGAAFGGGTNGSLAEILRFPPDTDAMDVVSFTANPQMHASDELTLVENLEPLAAMVDAARSVSGTRDVEISRLTLRPPFNQWATGPEPETLAGELPGSVDPRQMSLFGAAWTVAALRQLFDAGVSSLTVYESAGMAGLMERPGGPSVASFPSRPGMVFPVYHVLADLALREAGHPVGCVSSDSEAVVGLALRLPSEVRVLISNLTPERRRATIGPLPPGPRRIRTLDAGSVETAMFEPERFRAVETALENEGDIAEMALEPYATVSLRVGASRQG